MLLQDVAANALLCDKLTPLTSHSGKLTPMAKRAFGSEIAFLALSPRLRIFSPFARFDKTALPDFSFLSPISLSILLCLSETF